MATNGAPDAFAPSDVLAAVTTMRSGEQETKMKAHAYLEQFQKSVRCHQWPWEDDELTYWL
jgi:transportin-3